MTSRQKILLIDGLNTIFSNRYFIRDDIPRYLANYTDMGYSIWIYLITSEDMDTWSELNIPSWLREEILVVNTDMIDYIKTVDLHEESFAVSNDSRLLEKYNLDIEIFTPEQIFECKDYKPLEVADVVLCFGFDMAEFVKFCNHTKLIGVSDEDTDVNIKVKNPDGIAFLIDNHKAKNMKLEYENILNTLNQLIKSKRYKIQHDSKMLGVTFKGNGIKGVNLDILSGKQIPLLLV